VQQPPRFPSSPQPVLRNGFDADQAGGPHRQRRAPGPAQVGAVILQRAEQAVLERLERISRSRVG
jgi:hypothetical protein